MRFALPIALFAMGCLQQSTAKGGPDASARMAAAGPVDAGVPVPTAEISWSVHFSPHTPPDTGCEAEIVHIIQSAKPGGQIRLQAYGFTSQAIADALVAAKTGKNVDVVGIFDRSDKTAKNSKIPALTQAQIPVYIDSKHAISHNKVVTVDGHITETGSFNYTDQAEHHNAENCLTLDSPSITSAYNANWEIHRQHSTLLQ